MTLTENYSMVPPSSVCGYIFAHRDSDLFQRGGHGGGPADRLRTKEGNDIRRGGPLAVGQSLGNTIMTVIELINKAKSPLFTFELLPPLKGHSIERIYTAIDRLVEFSPAYINFTSHANEAVFVERA